MFTPALIASVLLVGVGMFVHALYPSMLTGVTHTIAYPFWVLEQRATTIVTDTAEVLRSKQALIRENKELKKQIQALQPQLRSRNLLYEENSTLKELFDRTTEEDTVLAVVLARPNTSLYDTLIVDVGTKNGVVSGDKVVVSGDIVVGIVDKVFAQTTVIKLFSTPGEEVIVMIGTQQIETTATGRGGGNFVARLPRDVGVEEGDSIIMPGITIKLFGVIEKIVTDPTQPFQTILFKNPVNMAEIGWVQIIRSHQLQDNNEQ